MYMPDPETAYRLLDVTTLDGTSKVPSHPLYNERVGCIGKLKVPATVSPEKSCVCVQFYRNAQGRRTNLRLRTSRLLDMDFSGDLLQVTTANSIYYFEKTELPEPEVLQEKDLVVLYLTNQGNYFCEGTWFDTAGVPHKLHCTEQTGMFVDSFLLEDEQHRIVCRYFQQWRGLCFYRAIYTQDVACSEFLLYNESDKPLKIQFEARADSFVVPAEEALRIPNLFWTKDCGL